MSLPMNAGQAPPLSSETSELLDCRVQLPLDPLHQTLQRSLSAGHGLSHAPTLMQIPCPSTYTPSLAAWLLSGNKYTCTFGLHWFLNLWVSASYNSKALSWQGGSSPNRLQHWPCKRRVREILHLSLHAVLEAVSVALHKRL